MNTFCQIEHVASDSNVDAVRQAMPWLSTAPEAATGAVGQATISVPRASERWATPGGGAHNDSAP
jgi:hypothetical protein